MLFALSASMVLVSSCDEKIGDDDKEVIDGDDKEVIDDGKIDDDVKIGTFTRMNIEDAKTLFIASSNSGSKIYGVKKTSLKSTSETDEEIYEIDFLDENGEQTEKKNPNHIFDAGDFVIVMFDYGESYFVNKTSGLIYAIPYEYNPTCWEYGLFFQNIFLNSGYKLYVDKNNNVYYNSGEYLCQVSSITSAAIQFKQVSAVNDKVYGSFCVDDDGQILYQTSVQKMRYRKSDDSFINMEQDFTFIWKGTDGLMYAIIWEHYDLYLIKIKNGEIIKLKNVTHSNGDDYSYNYYFKFENVFYIQGKIIGIPDYNYDNYLVDISSESLYKEIPCLVKPNMVLNNQLCYFDDKTFSCKIINIDNGEASLLYDLNESKLSNYDIDKIMSVTESGVIFSALQLSDGKYIVAKINLDNSVTIQQSIEGKVTVVMPLNLQSN